MRLLERLGQRDRGYAALRRAGRTALVMPALFALGDKVVGNAAVATFAAFGSFAMLLLVDFTGPMTQRLQAQAALAGAGALFVVVGSLAARNAWLAAASMTVVAFAVLFAGVVSSVLASAAPALLLAFILPVSLPGPAGQIPARLAGWALASVVALAAVALLWPAPANDPLRDSAAAAARALGARVRSDVAFLTGGAGAPSATEHRARVVESRGAIAGLRKAFLAAPYRPTGLSTPARTVVRLVDGLGWLGDVVDAAPPAAAHPVNRAACAVKVAAAAVLEAGADLLDRTGGSPDGVDAALVRLRRRLAELEDSADADLVTALDPAFRAQELSFAVSQVAANVTLTAAAERRTWLQRVLGRQPAGVAGPWAAAQERAVAHVEPHSVWLHNSVRGAAALGLAVLVADLSDVQHSFWVVLGTLSVLRSNALNTGANAMRGLLGTAVGFVVGALLLVPVGRHTTVLWILLPVAILLAGVLPAAVSFAAGQAAFTVTLVILFNIIEPTGWHVGLLRVEDIAIGCTVSLAVGLLFWPRGAAGALGRALAEAYTDTARYLAAAVDFGMLRCAPRAPGAAAPDAPTPEATRAAAASRRLDDAFRTYLAERGAKPLTLASMTALVNGVAGVRLAADAVRDLWQRDDGTDRADRTAARSEVLSSAAAVVGWFDALAVSLATGGRLPAPPVDDGSDARLVEVLRRDLLGTDQRAGLTAARMVWTGDYLDAMRRLQATLVGRESPAPAFAGVR